MAITKDWITEAAREIMIKMSSQVQQNTYGQVNAEMVAWVEGRILEHCPLKSNTVYMEVPRCDTCRHWQPLPSNAMSRSVGDCARIAVHTEYGSIQLGTALDFGCVQWEAKS